MKKDDILILLRSPSTVFTTRDVALLWSEPDADIVKRKLYRYHKTGKIYAIRKGIYAKDKNYNKFELANKIFTPSYISFETVLAKAGVIFQYYERIFLASYLSLEIKVDCQTYVYMKIKDSILTDLTGIEKTDGFYIASPERALLDVIYLNKDYYFDHLDNIDWEKAEKILPIYGNSRQMKNTIAKYRQAAQKESK